MTNNEIEKLEKALEVAQKKSLQWAERRHALPAGSSRARVTTANANWARAAEYRDLCRERLDAAKAKLANEQATVASSPSVVATSRIAIAQADRKCRELREALRELDLDNANHRADAD